MAELNAFLESIPLDPLPEELREEKPAEVRAYDAEGKEINNDG